jgi:hypothetical protein
MLALGPFAAVDLAAIVAVAVAVEQQRCQGPRLPGCPGPRCMGTVEPDSHCCVIKLQGQTDRQCSSEVQQPGRLTSDLHRPDLAF